MSESTSKAKPKVKQKNSFPKPAIPADEVTPDTIVGGIIVRLGRKEVFWRLDSGKVELNAFTGALTAKVDGRKLTEAEVYSIISGLRSGRIMVVDHMEEGKPVNTKWLTSEYAPRARILLDNKDGSFNEAVRRTFSLPVLETALEIEKEEKNRKERVGLLTSKLADIRQG